MTTIPAREQVHPSWCTDHQHAFLGALGECNGADREALHDEYGAGLTASPHWWDGDDEPWGTLSYLASPHGEQHARIDMAAIDLLLDLLDTHPDQLALMLRYLATTLRQDVTALNQAEVTDVVAQGTAH